jgi:hypothetical protein
VDFSIVGWALLGLGVLAISLASGMAMAGKVSKDREDINTGLSGILENSQIGATSRYDEVTGTYDLRPVLYAVDIQFAR